MLIVLSLVGIIVSGFHFSIDFVGGAEIDYHRATPVTTDQIQSVLDDLRPDRRDPAGGRRRQVSIRTDSFTDLPNNQQLVKDLADQAGLSPQEVNVEDIGPTWGQQISRKALRGLVARAVASSRCTSPGGSSGRWRSARWSRCVHDVVITAGIYALVGREVTPETVIAILTILGFSLYDTVVIYDKIKENTESAALTARLGYTGVVDLSLNQTVMRSVNTSLVVLLPILSLLLFGGTR